MENVLTAGLETSKLRDNNLGLLGYSVFGFAELADGQCLLGKDVQIAKVDGAPIPLFVAVYSEVEIDLNEISRRALMSLDGLADYFGYVPMPHYTMVLEYIVPPNAAT
jgi:hypothetical protein